MKKIILLITVLALMLSVSGCSMISFIQQENAERDKYINMTTAELEALSDEDLLYALYMRAVEKANTSWDLGEGAEQLPEAQKIFYVVYCFDVEFQNGGLCQFFVNSTRNLAPLLSECLSAVGAKEHSALFDAFVKDYEIDVTSLVSFVIGSESEFEAQYKRYPFGEFDTAMAALPSITELLITYARANLEAL